MTLVWGKNSETEEGRRDGREGGREGGREREREREGGREREEEEEEERRREGAEREEGKERRSREKTYRCSKCSHAAAWRASREALQASLPSSSSYTVAKSLELESRVSSTLHGGNR